MAFAFPSPLYPIADAGGPRTAIEIVEAAVAAGIRLVQLRVKEGSTRSFVALARAAKAITERAGAQLIINDRTDIALLVDAAGVHLGAGDLPPPAARSLLGPGKIIGVSTHSAAQLAAVEREGCADYVAYGPIFATGSKKRPDPPQGIERLRAIRRLTARPLVAIGGITAATLPAVLDAGADAVAVIAAIARAAQPADAAKALHEQALAIMARRPPRRT